MQKSKYFLLTILFFLLITSFITTHAKENDKFLSLKKNEVNLRQGPSFDYPIKLIYKKKYLPVIILDKSGPWRKIKDFENNSGWIHTVLLSKKKSAINIKNDSILFKKPTIYSKPIARLEMGRLVLIKKCNLEWCKITSGNFIGWMKKKFLWGNIN